MKLTQLKYFQTVCKYNNITRAAAELHVSQPSLSGAIKELEQEFGVTLFHRLSKGLDLTEEGRILLEEADLLLQQSEHLHARMHALTQTDPVIQIGVPPMLGSLIFPRIMQLFHARFPDIRIQITENGTLTNRIQVQDGLLDAAIISSDGALPASVRHCSLCDLDIYFYVSSAHPLSRRTLVDLSDLSDIPLVLLTRDSFLTDYILRNFKAMNLEPNVILNTNQLSTIQHLVENNTAAAFLLDGIFPPSDSYTKIPVSSMPRIKAQLIWNADRQPSPAMQKLIRLCRSEIPHLLY